MRVSKIGDLCFMDLPLLAVIITIILNYLLSFFWNTRSMDLVLGLLSLSFHLRHLLAAQSPDPETDHVPDRQRRSDRDL